jgi:hypothetical protein
MMWTRRVGSLLVGLLLVTSIVAGPAAASTGSTTTTEDLSDCDWKDALTFVYTGCTDVEDYNQSAHDLETHVDIYTHLSTEEAAAENYLTVMHNYRQDLDSRAWMIAEAEMAEAYQNGSSESEAESIVRTEVGDYYSLKQKNQIDRWNTSVAALEYALNRADQQGLDRSNVTNNYLDVINASEYPASEYEENEPARITGFETTNIKLANGTTTKVYAPRLEYNFSRSTTPSYAATGPTLITPDRMNWTEQIEGRPDGYTVTIQYYHTNIRAPTSDYSNFPLLTSWEWGDPYKGITDQENQTQSEVSSFISATYGDFSTGDLNASDLLSRVTIMEEYGLEGAGSNTTFTDVTAALAATGLKTPNLAETGYMNVTYTTDNGTTVYEHRKGMLAVRELNGTWNTNGTTYHTENITGPVMFARQDGALHDLNGSFTIHSATSKEGNEIDEVTTEDLDYQAANTTDLLNVINRSIELQGNISVHKSSSGGGGGGGGGDGDGGSPIAAAVVVGLSVLAALGIARAQ